MPLAALNPYRTPWTVKVKLTNKGQVREYQSARGKGKVCSVDFVDEEGTAIGATLWREAIEKYENVLEVGKVYYVSKGSLKPADKRYSTSGNDYEMNLDGRAEIDVCDDIDQSSAQKMPRRAHPPSSPSTSSRAESALAATSTSSPSSRK